MWIAKDNSSEVWAYTHKPIRDGLIWTLEDGIPLEENPEMVRFFDEGTIMELGLDVDWEEEPFEIEMYRSPQISKKVSIPEMFTFWAARDLDNAMYIYTKKPVRLDTVWNLPEPEYQIGSDLYESSEIFSRMFSDLKWEDEPIEVCIKRVCG